MQMTLNSRCNDWFYSCALIKMAWRHAALCNHKVSVWSSLSLFVCVGVNQVHQLIYRQIQSVLIAIRIFCSLSFEPVMLCVDSIDDMLITMYDHHRSQTDSFRPSKPFCFYSLKCRRSNAVWVCVIVIYDVQFFDEILSLKMERIDGFCWNFT